MFGQERLERGQTLAGGRRIVVEQLERPGVHGQSAVVQTPSGVQQRSQAVVPRLTPQRRRRRWRRRSRYRPGRPVVGDHGRRQPQVRPAATTAAPAAAAAATASPVAAPPAAAPSSAGLAAGTAAVVVRRFTPTAGSVRRRRIAVPAADVAATKRRWDGRRRRTPYGDRGRRWHSAVPASQSAARRAAAAVALVRRCRRRLRRPLSDVRELLSLLLAGK